MSKKKPESTEYTRKEVETSLEVIGNMMNQCSTEIWDVIEKFPLSPAMLYGILSSIQLTIANDIYSEPPEDIHVCNDCKETLKKKPKDDPKREKEVQGTMYG